MDRNHATWLLTQIMPSHSPLKQGMMLQNYYTGGLQIRQESTPNNNNNNHMYIYIYIYYLQTQQKCHAAAFLKIKNLLQCIKINIEFKIALFRYNGPTSFPFFFFSFFE